MNIIEIIKQIESDKISRKIEPHNATRIEVIKAVNKMADDEINRLISEGVISEGKTLNDTFYRTNG